MCNFEDHVIWSLNWQIADIQDTIFNLRKLYSLRFPRIFFMRIWDNFFNVFTNFNDVNQIQSTEWHIIFSESYEGQTTNIQKPVVSWTNLQKKLFLNIFQDRYITRFIRANSRTLLIKRNNTEFNILSTIGSITIFSHIFNIVNGTIFRWNNILK